MKKKIAFVSGHFNVLHAGHLRLFKYAKEFAEKLIVGVESDHLALDSAYVTDDLRLEGVQSCNYVDEAFLINTSVVDCINDLRPDLVVKGREFEDKVNIEEKALDTYGGKLIFSSGDSIFSTSDLILREILQGAQKESVSTNIDSLIGYKKRNHVTKNNLLNIISDFNKINVVVVGDLIIDEYISCLPLGMSQEDSTIVVTPIDSRKFLGGAGIVAAHAASLGANVKFLSVAGDDQNYKLAISLLRDFGVNAKIFKDKSRPTTQKTRFRSQGKSLLRVSHLHQDPISTELQKSIISNFKQHSKWANLVIFSDFNYGCLPQALVEDFIKESRERNIKVAADSQSSSQIGDIGRYHGMDLITPTEREARIAMKNQSDGLVRLAENLKKFTSSKNILLKLGEEGLLVQSSGPYGHEVLTDQISALNLNPVDVSGAGDSLLVASSLAMALGANIWEMGLLGSLAASIQVGRLGNVPIKSEELLQKVNLLP